MFLTLQPFCKHAIQQISYKNDEKSSKYVAHWWSVSRLTKLQSIDLDATSSPMYTRTHINCRMQQIRYKDWAISSQHGLHSWSMSTHQTTILTISMQPYIDTLIHQVCNATEQLQTLRNLFPSQIVFMIHPNTKSQSLKSQQKIIVLHWYISYVMQRIRYKCWEISSKQTLHSWSVYAPDHDPWNLDTTLDWYTLIHQAWDNATDKFTKSVSISKHNPPLPWASRHRNPMFQGSWGLCYLLFSTNLFVFHPKALLNQLGGLCAATELLVSNP